MTKAKILLFFLILSVRLLSQTSADTTIQYPALNKAYVKSYRTDTKAWISSPLRFNAKQWITTGTIVAAGALLYTQDEPIHDFFIKHRSASMDNMSKYLFEPFGNGLGTMAVVGASYLGGIAFKNTRLTGTSLIAVKALVASMALTFGIKHLAHRHRPFQDDPANHAKWEGPFGNIKYASFSSGHSAAAFSVATVYALEYKGTEWIPMLAYALATGTAISRMYDNKHWASDVFIGSAIGCATGAFMWAQSKKTKNPVQVNISHWGDSYSATLIIPIKYNKTVAKNLIFQPYFLQ